MISWIWCQKYRQQSKNRQVGIYQTKNLLQAKGNINRVKKQASTNYIGINFQTNKEFLQLKKKKIQNLITHLKNWPGAWIDSSLKKTYKWPVGVWKMVDIVNHQGNVNQNQKEISSHTCQNDFFFFLRHLSVCKAVEKLTLFVYLSTWNV